MNRTINRYIMDELTSSIDITKSTDENVINDEKFEAKFNSDYNLLLRRNWSTRRRYLNNIKSPPLMPQFTDVGFKHTKAPKEICDYVTQFYQSQKDKKRLESFPVDGTQVFLFLCYCNTTTSAVFFVCFVFYSFTNK